MDRARPAGRRLRRLLAVVAALLLVGSPAAADPAGPTNFRSSVTEVVPTDGLAGAEVEILGGDAFLVVRATSGTRVEVPGYEGEPYLRIAPDGTVQLNTRSPARWLNDARFGEADVEVPAQADPDAPPQWETVATDGTYAWHDHRIHFMSPSLPPGVEPDVDAAQPVQSWAVPLLVDGEEVELRGELAWLPGPGPAIPVGAVLLAAVAGIVLAVRRPSWLSPAIAVTAIAAAAVGAAGAVGLPTGADADPSLLVLPAVSLAVLVGARIWAARAPEAARWFTPAAALPLAVWAVLQLGALTRPIVPNLLPVEVVRGVVAVCWGVTAAAVIVFARRLLELTSLDREERA